MTWTKYLFLVPIIACCTYCYAKNSKNQSLKQQQSQVSEDLAHVIWNIMTTYEGEYNFRELMLNLKKLNTGQVQSKPLKDCYDSLITSLKNKAKKKEILNLQAAESYLCKMSNRDDIHEIVKDKLYYKTATTGTGEELKNTNNTPFDFF